jgi:hypothetical protein
MSGGLSEIFFRPEELAWERLTIPATLYNQCRLILTRGQYERVFVPVRSMQFQAAIDEEEVIFIDNHAYAVKDGKGGRLIRLAWRFHRGWNREGINEPAPIDLIYYDEKTRELHNRLVGEFKKALDELEARCNEKGCDTHQVKVLLFPSSK